MITSKSARIACFLAVTAGALAIRQPAGSAEDVNAEGAVPGLPAAPPASAALSKKQIQSMLTEALTTLRKCQDVLRLASVKLPGLVTDNLLFRKLDRELERAREESYPAVNAAERLKSAPAALRDAVRLYLSMRVLQERLMVFSTNLSTVESAAAAPLAAQVADLSNKIGRQALNLQPYVFKVMDAYQQATPEAKVEGSIVLDEENLQGPGL